MADKPVQDDFAALRVTRAVHEEALVLIKKLKLDDAVQVITAQGQCRVHLPTGDEPSKKCCTCHHTFSLPSFNRNRANSDGYQSHCRQCDYTTLSRRRKDVKNKTRVAIQKAASEAKKEIKAELRGGKGKITREKWPVNRDARLKELKRVLPIAIDQYDGQEAAICVALSVSADEVRECIEGDKELTRAAEHAKTVALSKVEANLYELAKTSNNVTAVKFWLTNNSDKWSERSSLDVRNVGFGAPDEDASPAPILKIVNHTPED